MHLLIGIVLQKYISILLPRDKVWIRKARQMTEYFSLMPVIKIMSGPLESSRGDPLVLCLAMHS